MHMTMYNQVSILELFCAANPWMNFSQKRRIAHYQTRNAGIPVL